MILITGASGSVGRMVLAEVARGGERVRAMYRSKEEAVKAPAGTEAVIADFSKKASLLPAMRGVRDEYLVCSPIPELVQLEGNAIEASVEAGVQRIVLNSAMGAGDYGKSFPSWHRAVEDKLKGTKLAHCILRPNSFLQNVLTYYAPSIRAQGAFYGSMGNARTSYLDVRDIAPWRRRLRSRELDGKTYELNGPEALTCTEVAEKISRRAGIPVQYVDIPAEAQRKAMLDQGMPEWQVTALLELQGLSLRRGEGWTTECRGAVGAASDHDGSIPGRVCARVSRSGGEGLIKRFTMEPINAKTGMTHAEAREFIRSHFEEFVNRKNMQIGNVNFAVDFVDHGADVPPGTPPGPAGAIAIRERRVEAKFRGSACTNRRHDCRR